MTRINVVTGAASGIGKATRELLLERGEQVIGVDIHDADIITDLSVPEGRAAMRSAVERRSAGHVDAVFAVAGLATPTPDTASVNYFGMTGTLVDLRPLLLASPAPRAVAVTSMASLMPVDEPLVALLAAGDETEARARAEILAKDDALAATIYASTKKAMSQWIRRTAATADWAGASIPLNAVAPGIIITPMTTPMMQSDADRAMLEQMVPMPLNGWAEPIVVARLLVWLASAENTHVCGQVVFIDGGSDVVIRGDSTW